MGYYVSIGFVGMEKNVDGIFEVERMVAEAESVMFQEKMAFYQENNLPIQRTHDGA